MRHIVRDPRLERLTGGGASSAVGDVSVSQQPEIILIPLIPDYFPSSVSPLFQQLMQVRREATVSYYYRDARSTVAEHTVVRDHAGSDKELYNWYMSLSEQRLMETDNELIALSRAGRVVSPVPCAVAFVYNANAAPATSSSSSAVVVATAAGPDTSAAATTATASDGAASLTNSGSNTKRKDTSRNKQHRRGKASTGGFNNGYMTIENTVRVPHHNMRVRVFGFVGDTSFCPPAMLPSQAAKSPMCLTIFLSKSAGGNHRVQVTLLAAHTYMQQLQEIGILRYVDRGVGGPSAADTVAAAAANGAGCSKASSPLPGSLAAESTDDMDPLAGLRCAGVGSRAHFPNSDPYRDPYADPYSVDENADPYAVAGESEHEPQLQQPPTACHVPRGGSNTLLDGLGGALLSPAMEVAKETILRRPLEMVMHRADVPALCYVRELRARMDEDTAAATITAAASSTTRSADHLHDDEGEEGATNVDSSSGGRGGKNNGSQKRSRMQHNSSQAEARSGVVSHNLYEKEDDDDSEQHSLKRLIHTVIREEELHGLIDAESMGRVLLWASCFYVTHFEQLVGGEAARLRQELAQRNLSENPLDGTLSLTEDEPRPPKTLPATGDVWIPPHDTYVEVRETLSVPGGASNENSANHLLHHEMENWKTVVAGTVLRYYAAQIDTASTATASGGACRGAWRVSKREFAEDILLSLCRNACHASRGAPPTDEHWLLNRETGLPEGLMAGLLIWRELAAGQVVYYGTTPDFLKQWLQSGAEVEAAYRHQAKKAHVVGAGAADATKDGDENSKSVTSSLGAAAGENGAAPAATCHSTSITVATTSAAAATTAASKGLRSSYDANLLAKLSGVSSGSRGSSIKEQDKGSGSSSMALYSAHTGFVCAPEQNAKTPLGPKCDASSPTSNGPASTAERSSNGSGLSAEARKTKARRVLTETSTPAAAVSGGACDVAKVSTPVAHSRAVLGSSAGSSVDGRLTHSLSAKQHSPFAAPVASSWSVVHTPSSAASSASRSSHMYSNLGYLDQLGSLSGGHANARAPHVSNPFAYPTSSSASNHQQQLSHHDHGMPVNLANACWIRVPDPTSRDGANTPTVNVVVKQRRSVRLTTGISLLDSPSGNYARALQEQQQQPWGDIATTSATQPISVGTAAGGSTAVMARGSLPIHILGSRGSSSEDSSFRHGCHSPTLQEQSRSLLHGDDALISHAAATRAEPISRTTPQHSAAMDVRPNYVGTPVESSTSLKWTTSNAAQPSSMRGASVSFASGSARHGSLLQGLRYQELCQPVLSRPSSSSRSELLASSASSSVGSFQRKEAMRPPPLFADGNVESRPADGKSVGASVPSQNTTDGTSLARTSAAGGQTKMPLISAVPMAVAGGDAGAGVHSRNNSAAHTPRQENMSDSAKSSVGSGKYRWEWRGVSLSS